MVIGGIVEGGVFCHDMGDVQISGVSGNITVKYQVSGPDMDSARGGLGIGAMEPLEP